MSADFQQELASLGMAGSPSFVREPEGNGVAGPFIRTLKENSLRVRHFATVAELIERHGFRTPSQARIGFAATSKYLDGGPGIP
jgi:hypothetical protein